MFASTMCAPIPLLATSSPDGLAAWRAVVGEFRRTLDDPLAGLPLVLVAGGIALAVWVNYRVAKAVLASFEHHHAGPDPVDHHA